MTDVATAAPAPVFSASEGLADWLAQHAVSLAFTTYQASKLFFVSAASEGRLRFRERTFEHCMGLCGGPDTLYLGTSYQVWRLDDVLDGERTGDGDDRLYVPQVGYTTGDIDAHDMAVDDVGRVVFANTRFSCIAALSARRSFVPLWRPPFISLLAPEDRCHLNGLALEDGELAYASIVGCTDEPEGWRSQRVDGGVVMDTRTDRVVAEGLSMPHSPRVHRHDLWILESGRGRFGRLDRDTGRLDVAAFCPGYARGLTFVGSHAVIGLSRPRENDTFGDFPLAEELARRGIEAGTGLMVVDTDSGEVLHWLRIDGVIQELYDVVSLPGVRSPGCVGFKSDDIRRTISVGGANDVIRERSMETRGGQ